MRILKGCNLLKINYNGDSIAKAIFQLKIMIIIMNFAFRNVDNKFSWSRFPSVNIKPNISEHMIFTLSMMICHIAFNKNVQKL
jgi:hypothetical protein